jgi:hypothetical protein
MRRAFVILALVVVMYIGAYAALFAFRVPAANMMYFAFFKSPDSVFERPTFYSFYPIYKIQRLLDGPPHNFDRPAIVDAEGA